MNLIEFLQDLSLKGVKLWSDGGKLRTGGSQEVLTTDSVAQLKQYKSEILHLLKENPDICKVHPLSYVQKGLWFLWMLSPQNHNYNLSFSLRIYSLVDITIWKQVFQALRERHPLLRSTFPNLGEQPVQQLHQHQELDFLQIDASSWSEEELYQKAVEAHRHPFNLETESVMRVRWFTCSEANHIMLMTIHHIALDGWSYNLIAKELLQLYQAEKYGVETSLPPLNNSYQDYVRWQKELVEGQFGEQLWNYWQQKLAGELPVLNLPTDRPRPPIQTYNGGSYSFKLSEKLTEQLKELAQTEGVTLYMILLATFQVLLYRYTGQVDILVGSPTSGRTKAEFTSIVGCFVDSMVMRADLSGNPFFRDFLLQVRETVLGALAHQDYPFPLLVDKLQVERDSSRSPIFQTYFILQKFQESQGWQNVFLSSKKTLMNWGGLEVEPFALDQQEGLYDLDLEMFEEDSHLLGFLKYNTDLFDGSTIERMVGHLENLLSEIVENPSQKVSELPILSAAERHQLLVKLNDTEVEYPQDKCIHQLFEEQVEKTPDAVAVVFEGEKLTYQQLNQQANQLGHYLRAFKVGSGVLVGISVEPSLDQVVSLLSVLKAGGVYVPLDPNYPQERLAFMEEDSKVQVVLTKEPRLDNSSLQHSRIVCLDRERDVIGQESSENLACHTTPDDLAYAIYTSGSTGKPKAVLGRIRSTVNRLNWMWEMLPFAADEICCQKTSINFVDHVAEIFSPLLKGIPLVIVRDDIRGDVPQLMNLLRDRKITRIVLVPSLLKAMLEYGSEQLTQFQYLKYVFCSGETLPLNLARAFQQKISSARLFNIYGSSEVAADVTCFEVNLWQTRQKILQYFTPQVLQNVNRNHVPGFDKKPFTKPGVSVETLAPKFQHSKLPLYPLKVEDYYDKLSQEVLPYVIDTGSPTFIGHMTSALPDFMHDMSKLISRLNQNLVKIETSKSLIFLEREALAILHRLVYNFADEFYQENIQQKNRNLGVVTTGGTTANISALLCARNRGLLSQENSQELSKESIYRVLSKKGYQDIVLIGSRLMHYSINKATSILGMGTKNVVYIDTNSDGKLDLDLLVENIRECRNKELYVLAIVGIAGTTETGEIDPLVEMGNIAQEFGIHFHVDAAWGGATMFSERHKGKLEGIEKADTITICGHKQLYLPQGISVCLFKDPQMLNFAETTARYQAQRDTFDMGRFTIEGSRSALSLCLHGSLHIIGKRGYEILIDDGIEKAQYFSRLIQMLEPFELIMEPALNIVNYRYIPGDLRSKVKQKSLTDSDIERINQLNTQIQKEQFERGMTFVSKTTLIDTGHDQGKEIVVFRTVLSNPNTTTVDLHSVLEEQLRIANQIETKSKNKLVEFITPDAVAMQEMIYLDQAENPKENLEEALEEYLKKNTVPIGKPIANTQIYILDKYGNLLPPGITGELYVGGEGIAQGYLNQPELTQEKFILNPFTKDNKSKNTEANRLYKTGDQARWLPDGNIEFVGRIDNQVKLRGFRIELGEIEALLNGLSQIQQAVVIAREDVPGNKRLVAYIVASDESLSTKELREFTKQKLPEYMIPSAFVALDSFPLTPNGKIDRKALPAPEGISPEQEYVAPKTEVEQHLAQIWQDVLQIEKVGIYDNFFEMGGNSLLLVKVISKLQKLLKMELQVVELFKYPNIYYLSEYIKSGTPKTNNLTEARDVRDSKLKEGKRNMRRRLESRQRHRPKNKIRE